MLNKDQALAFLDAAARLVERIGGKRRRGAGRCKMTLQLKSRTSFSLLNVETPDLPTEQDRPEAELDLKKAIPAATSGHVEKWVTLPVEIDIESPLIVASRVMGNVVTSLDYIPGYYLLKHFSDGFGKDFWTYVASGDLQLTSFYPMIDRKPGLPAPRCLERLKVRIEQHHRQEKSRRPPVRPRR